MSHEFKFTPPGGPGPDNGLYMSPLGTPVMQDITFKQDSYIDFNGNEYTFPEIKLINVLISVSKKHRVITTEIPGRDGTVKEYIGQHDKQISIVGIITGGNGHYPLEEVAAFNKMIEFDGPVQVINTFLNMAVNVYNVVIKDCTFEQEPGGYSQQRFSLDCISDMPVELQFAGPAN